MRAIVNTEPAPHRVELRDVPRPDPAHDEVLLHVRGVGVCGSDLHQWHNTHAWPVRYPVTLGHEFGGEVVEVGNDVQGFQPGDRVVSETAARICGRCVYCRSGNYNVCPQRLGFGYGVDGAMADYVAVPARCLHRVPNGVPMEDAALTEPGCVAANAVLELSRVQPGDFVVVLGPGPIGLMSLQMARLGTPGALWAVGTERDTDRLAVARDLGATETLIAGRDDVTARVHEHADGFGAHLVVDCVGVSDTLRQAIEIVRPMGQITKVGWGPAPVGFSLDPLVQKAARLQGAFSHTWKTWERVLGLYAAGAVRPSAIRKVFPLDRWQDAFEAMDSLAVPKSVLVP